MRARIRFPKQAPILALAAAIAAFPAAATAARTTLPVHAAGAAASAALLTPQPDDGPDCRKNPDDPRCRVG